MLQMYRRELIDSAGDLYCALGWAFSRGKDSDCSNYDRKAYVFSNCAGASIYRKDLLFELGLFDERHESYLEDVDIGYRARINGYRNVYVPKAYVYHAGSGVSGSRHNEFKVNLSARNSVFLAYKNMPLLQLLINLPFLIVGHVVKLCFFAGKGLAVSYVKGLVAGIKLCFKSEKYTFSSKFIINYVKIQLELWINLGLRFFGNSGN